MSRAENTIYIRPSRHPQGEWETFVKTRGEGAMTCVAGGIDENVEAAGLLLWALNRFGPNGYLDQGPLDTHPERPSLAQIKRMYPVVYEA